jgi:hypothetical protein
MNNSSLPQSIEFNICTTECSSGRSDCAEQHFCV